MLILIWIPGHWLNMVEDNVPGPYFSLDKVIHFSLFMFFGFFWTRTAPDLRRILPVLLVGIFLAVVSELVQGLPAIKRDPDKMDALADVLGLFAGVLLQLGWVGFRNRTKSVEAGTS